MSNGGKNMTTIDEVARRDEKHYDIFEIADIRKRAGKFDKVLDKCFEQLLDEEIMVTTPIHRNILENIDEVRKLYGKTTAGFYDKMYTEVLRELRKVNNL